MNATTFYRELIEWLLSHVKDSDMALMQTMVKCCAFSWLLYRAWKTMWKPVPELIHVLGIEVPDSPSVSLGGIKADAVTLHWTRPEPHKAVFKYLIQVNGVNVGVASKTETAITVTGLKPSHFYNVRVIAVGSNNFQTGSKVIRLQTYDRCGRPNLPNGRLPSSFVPEEVQTSAVVEDNDTSAGVRGHGTAIEAATVSEAAPNMAREHSGSHPGPRRNTVSRKHSGSTGGAEQRPVIAGSEPQESMQQLTEKFESIREETEEVNSTIAKEAEDFNAQMAELEKEKTRLRQILREKEEASEKLKKEVNYAERANRQAQNRRSQKEKELKEKQAERAKKRQDISKWRKDLEAMKEERGVWAEETKDMQLLHEKRMAELRAVLKQEQEIISRLEEEIRIKGRQIKELETQRQNLPGAEDDEDTNTQNELERQKDLEWEIREGEFIARLNSQRVVMQQIAADTERIQMVYREVLPTQPVSGSSMMHDGNPPGLDAEPSGKHKGRQRRGRHRKSRNGTMSSPSGYLSSYDQPYGSGGSYDMNSLEIPSVASGPYRYPELSTHGSGTTHFSDHDGTNELEFRSMSAGAPLSPTATALLPSDMFTDDDPPIPPGTSKSSFAPLFMHRNFENNSQSPLSDGSRSASLLSSPHNSTLNFKRHSGNMEAYTEHDHLTNSMSSIPQDFGVGSDGSSGNQASSRRFDIFALRSRGKTVPDDGLPLGSLKPGQSQSFPRQTDDNAPPGLRNRRTSFTSGWANLGFRGRHPPAGGEVSEGNGPAPARDAGIGRRRRGIFGTAFSRDESHSVFDPNPSSPRPASIASSDLPRPSTDSARVLWGQAGEGTSLHAWTSASEIAAMNRNSPLATNWAVGVAQPWSRNPSRRPSIRENSTPSLNHKSRGIVSDDDEFLPLPYHQSSPPPAGVIGGPRPKSSHKPTPPPVTPKLNPAAPTFKTIFTRSSKPEKDKAKAKMKEKDAEVPAVESREETSPAASRKSRDTRSIRTEVSHAESQDSFPDGLERETSSTASEMAPSSTSTKGESSIQKLLRKGSSSKFGFSAKGNLWGSINKKAGGGSGAGSDLNVSGDRLYDFDEKDNAGLDMLAKSFESNASFGGKESATSSPTIGGSAGGFGERSSRRSLNLGAWGRGMLSKGKKETGENEAGGLSAEDVEDGNGNV